MLFGAGAAISGHALLRAGDVHQPPAAYAIWPLIGSIGIKSALCGVKFRFGKKIGSSALAADAWNDAVDIVSGLAALAAVGLTIYDPQRFLAADHYGGFAVGVIVIFTGLRVTRDTGLQLMDTMPSERMMRTIREVAQQVSGVEGVEKCFARKTGLQYHVDLHLEVDPEITVRSSHDIAERVRNRTVAMAGMGGRRARACGTFAQPSPQAGNVGAHTGTVRHKSVLETLLKQSVFGSHANLGACQKEDDGGDEPRPPCPNQTHGQQHA